MTPPVVRRTRGGHVYKVWKRRVPRIPRDWLDTIVYVYPTVESARSGERFGGTGFVVVVPPDDPELPQGLGHYYIVTNAHCVEAPESVAVRVNLRGGGSEVLSFAKDEWQLHPDGDDLAAVYFDLGSFNHMFRYMGINKAMILTPELQTQHGFGPGDDVFFMGRYVDIDGKEHNEPVLRSGMLSGTPSEPVFQRERGHQQETILVEARSLSGFSGSPVFVWSPHQLERREDGVPIANVVLGPPCFLLGIDYGHHPWRESVRSKENKGKPDADLFIEGNSGMMLVIPAQKLLELLETNELVEPRREKEAREWELRGSSAAVLDIADADGEPGEFERFEDLTRKLVQTPKPQTGA